MIRVRTLGQCTIQIDDVRVGPDAEIVFATLLLLTIGPGRRISRGELLGMLWPETPSPRAFHCLRQSIYRLRTLGVDLEVERTDLSIPAGSVDSDVDTLLRSNGQDPLDLAEKIGGPFLPGYAPTFSEPLRDWVERERDLITSAARRVLVGALSARKARSEWADVERLAHRCLSLDPLNEDATLALAEAAALHGAKAEALAVLDRYLREMGPTARELRAPVTALRRRIAEPALGVPLLAPGHLPFIGRSEELARLRFALSDARSGQGAVYFIHGEPGIGKTRLVNEFTRAAALEGLTVTQLSCQSSDARRPLSAFTDAAPKLMSMPGALGCSPYSHKYLRRLVEHQRQRAQPEADTSEAALLYANVRWSLFDLFDAIASESPLILTIEDTHWLDVASWEIVAEAVSWIATRRMILILTSRAPKPSSPAEALGFADGPHVLRLGPIDRGACEKLVMATLDQHSRTATPEFCQWCVEMSGGNPYYLSELALHGLRARGEFAVPPTLSNLVAQRVARLHPTSCRLLQACAILGKNATLGRIEHVLDQGRIDVLNGLDDLEAAGMLENRGDHVVARHDLLAEAATARASVSSQRLLHLQAARVLQEEFVVTRTPALAWDSAEHWRLSGEPHKGIELLRECAHHSLQLGRSLEAVETLRRVLLWCPPGDTRVQVFREYVHSLRACERWRDLVEALDELLTELGEEGDPQITSGYRLERLEARWMIGEHSLEIAHALTSEFCRGLAAPQPLLRAATTALVVSDNLCSPQTAHRINQVAGPLAQRHADELVSNDYELVYHCSFGDLSRAVEVASDLLARLRPTGNEPLLCRYLLRAAQVFEVGNRLDHALECAREAYRIAERLSLTVSASHAARWLAWASLDRLENDELAAWTQRASAWAQRTQHPASVADVVMLQAEVALNQGFLAEASGLHAESNRLWNPLKHSRSEAHALCFGIVLSVESGREISPDQIADTWRLFHALAGHVGLDLLVGRFALGLAVAGKAGESAKMVDEFLSSFRRDLGPLRPSLKQLLARAQSAVCLPKTAPMTAGVCSSLA